jgi:hypothetical protein
MSKHLSEDQFAKCLVGQSTSAELQHITECADCNNELDRLAATLSLFRNALRDRIDARVASQAPRVSRLPLRHHPDASGIPQWRWALAAAAVVVLVTVPFLTREKEPQTVVEKAPPQMDPDALMNAVNLHLSRTVPAPMERMISLMPSDESTNKSGGVQ